MRGVAPCRPEERISFNSPPVNSLAMGNRSRVLGKVLVLALVLMAILVLSFVVVMGYHMTRMESESYNSLYHYELTMSTTGPLENAVLLVPIPSYYNDTTGRNETAVDLSTVSFNNIDPENVSVTLEEVGDLQMLNISSERITPLYTNFIQPIGIMPGQNKSELPQPTHFYSDRYSEETPVLLSMGMYMYRSGIDHEINTRSPIGNEPLFMPYTIVQTLDNDADIMVDGIYVPGGATGYIIEVPVILSFDADEENVLSITAEFQGINEWWVLGWRSNSYRERITMECTGPCSGTYAARGVLITGEGVY